MLCVLSGCGSSANPFNWFGNDAPEADVLDPIDDDNPLIPQSTGVFSSSDARVVEYQGTAIDVVKDVTIERVPGGIIVRAVGLAATQGPFNARLISGNENGEPVDGILVFLFEAEYSQVFGGPEAIREVVVARRLTEQDTGGARTIRVVGRTNAIERRR